MESAMLLLRAETQQNHHTPIVAPATPRFLRSIGRSQGDNNRSENNVRR
jgi:hypothetical protein